MTMNLTKFKILLYTTKELTELSRLSTTCESFCQELCISLSITPIAFTIFGLREANTNYYLPGCKTIESNKTYEFRVRYHMPSLAEFYELDKKAFDYFYHQMRCDMENSQIEDLKYPNHKEKIAGLAITNVLIDLIERNLTFQSLKPYLHSYFPEKFHQKHKKALTKTVGKHLTKIDNSRHDVL